MVSEVSEVSEMSEAGAEGPAPAPTAEVPVPAPAPAPEATLEKVHESTTLLDYTTRSSALHYTTLDLDVQHCNRLLFVHVKIYIIKE